jgi:hypothetical protein
MRVIIGIALFILILVPGIIAQPAEPKEVAVFDDLARPSEIHLHNGRFYVADFPSIYVYSAEDYRLIKKFGRQGEGPREFIRLVRLHFTDQHVIVQSEGRLTYYDHKLDYIKEQKISQHANRGLEIIKNGFIMARNQIKEDDNAGNDIQQLLELCDPEGKAVKELYRKRYYFKITQDVNAIYLPEVERRAGVRFHVFDEKLFIEGEDGETGNIYVLDFNGKKRYTISHSYSKLKVTERHKQAVGEWFEMKRRRLFKILQERKQIWYPEYFPMVHYFSIFDGIIYTIPYKLEQGKCLLHKFRPDGTFIGKLPVPLVKDTIFSFSPFTIKGNTIYQLVESDDGDWALQLIDIRPESR